MIKIGMVVYPGSNCDLDCRWAFKRIFGIDLVNIDHRETSLSGLDGLILPGGFSYGDYLRAGALAAHAPIAKAIQDFAVTLRPILGICNGFQILTELKILPGMLMQNDGGKFICRWQRLELGEADNYMGRYLREEFPQTVFNLPIAHGEGRYMRTSTPPAEEVTFIYSGKNPNGSVSAVAGLGSTSGTIIGMMPHPERACFPWHASQDGLPILRAFKAACASAHPKEPS